MAPMQDNEEPASTDCAPHDSVSATSKTRQLLKEAKASAMNKLAAISTNSKSNNGFGSFGKESPAALSPLIRTVVPRGSRRSGNQKTWSLNEAPFSSPSIDCGECGTRMSSIGLVKPFQCFKCCRLFCSQHSPQIKNGVTTELLTVSDGVPTWQRACMACYLKARSIPAIGASRSHFADFKVIREEIECFREIEVTRLQKRLEKLADFNNNSLRFRDFERSVIPWQDDSSASGCYLCREAFNPVLLRRRHHCRLCGRLICGECVRLIPLRLRDGQALELKSCHKCHGLLFKKKIDVALTANLQKLQALFKTSLHLRQQLLETIPKFNEYLLVIDPRDRESSKQQQLRHDAWALRDTLILISLHLRTVMLEMAEVAGIEALDEAASVWRIFGDNVKRAAGGFIQKHMFTLQILEEAENGARSGDQRNSKELIDLKDLREHDGSATASDPASPTLKSKLKRLIPAILMSSTTMSASMSLPLESFDLFNQEGDHLSHDLIRNTFLLREKAAVLKEQREQLRVSLGETEDLSTRSALTRAIAEVEDELERMKAFHQ